MVLSTEECQDVVRWLQRMRPREAERLFRWTGVANRQVIAARVRSVDDRLLGVMLDEPSVWQILTAKGRLPPEQRGIVADALLGELEPKRSQRVVPGRCRSAAQGLRALVRSGYTFTGPQRTSVRRILTKGNATAAGHLAIELHHESRRILPESQDLFGAAMNRALRNNRSGRALATDYLERLDLPTAVVELIAWEWGWDLRVAEAAVSHPSASTVAWQNTLLRHHRSPWLNRSLWSEVFRRGCLSTDGRRLAWALEHVPTELVPEVLDLKSLSAWIGAVTPGDARLGLRALAERAPAVFMDLVEAGGVPASVDLQPADYVAVFEADEVRERAISGASALIRAGQVQRPTSG